MFLINSGISAQVSLEAVKVAINMAAAVSHSNSIPPMFNEPPGTALEGSAHTFSVIPAYDNEGKDAATRLKTRKDLIVALEIGSGG